MRFQRLYGTHVDFLFDDKLESLQKFLQVDLLLASLPTLSFERAPAGEGRDDWNESFIVYVVRPTMPNVRVGVTDADPSAKSEQDRIWDLIIKSSTGS